MGTVYLAEHTLMHKRLAIKVLHPEMTRLPEVVARFEREAMAAAHIEHPNVASATDFGKLEDGSFFLVLEYVQGKSLREVVEEGPLHPVRAVHIATQISSALVRAHGLGIVHRDLKPENVMLVERDGDANFAKVLDFGIAKVPVAEIVGKSANAGQRQALTQLGMVYGTPEYMAPEQALGQEVDARADLYALGVMLYEMLTGLRPFEADSPVTLLGMQVTQPPPSFKQRAPDVSVPAELEALVMKLLEKEAGARPGDAREVLDALDEQTLMMRMGPRLSGSFPNIAVDASGTPISIVGMPANAAADRLVSARTAIDLARPSSAIEPARAMAAKGEGTARKTMVAAAGHVGDLFDQIRPVVNRVMKRARDLAPEVQGRVALWHARLPKPLRVVPPLGWIGATAGALVLVVVLGALLLCSAHPIKAVSAYSKGAQGQTPAPSSSKQPEHKATEEELKEAQAKGSEAVEELIKRYPQDPQPLKLLARLQMAANTHARAIDTYHQLFLTDPSMGSDIEIGQNVVIATQVEGSSDAAYAMLESEMGSRGLDLLYWLAYDSKAQSKYVMRAAKILSKREVFDRASAATRIAIEFRNTAGCEGKYKLLSRVKTDGDGRMLKLLQPLFTSRGCGIFGLGDCWGCMRRGGGQLLSSTVKEIEERIRSDAGPAAADGGE